MKPTKHELHHVLAAIRMCRKASIQIERVRVLMASRCNVAKIGDAALFYMIAEATDKPDPFAWLVHEISKSK